MENKKPFEELAEVWKRVEAARLKPEDSAKLMPRKKPRGIPLRPFPPKERPEQGDDSFRAP